MLDHDGYYLYIYSFCEGKSGGHIRLDIFQMCNKRCDINKMMKMDINPLKSISNKLDELNLQS